MKYSTLLSAAAAFCIAAALPPLTQHALAQPAPAQPAPAQPAPAQTPMMNDPYGDGTATRADAQTMASARFDQLDTDHDGTLSPEELAAGRPARAQRMGGQVGPGGQTGHGGGRMGGMGRGMDANGDGKTTRDEYVAAALRRYDAMDENKDGKLTKEERTNFFEDMRARMMLRMGGGAGN